jgi:hypothetical protein
MKEGFTVSPSSGPWGHSRDRPFLKEAPRFGLGNFAILRTWDFLHAFWQAAPAGT